MQMNRIQWHHPSHISRNGTLYNVKNNVPKKWLKIKKNKNGYVALIWNYCDRIDRGQQGGPFKSEEEAVEWIEAEI